MGIESTSVNPVITGSVFRIPAFAGMTVVCAGMTLAFLNLPPCRRGACPRADGGGNGSCCPCRKGSYEKNGLTLFYNDYSLIGEYKAMGKFNPAVNEHEKQEFERQ